MNNELFITLENESSVLVIPHIFKVAKNVINNSLTGSVPRFEYTYQLEIYFGNSITTKTYETEGELNNAYYSLLQNISNYYNTRSAQDNG
jgi:hypothetical protein